MPLRLKAHNKYGAVKTSVDGITFDSKREAARYQELRLLEKASVIKDLRLQPEFTLCPWMPDHSDIRAVGKFIADFAYDECDHGNGHSGWRLVVEDAKGVRTPLYKWKKKHFELQYGIEIREI